MLGAQAAGGLSFVAGLLVYRSYEQRPVFDRWSYSFFVFLVFSAIIVVLHLVRSCRSRNHLTSRSLASKFRTGCVDLAILIWGSGYLVDALDASDNGGRILDLNLFGAVTPSTAFADYLVLFLLLSVATSLLLENRHHRWIRGCLMVIPLLWLLLLGEGIARLVAIVVPTPAGFGTHSTTLWMRRYVHLNRFGWRDREHELVRDTSVGRVVVVGDSFGFGWGLERIDDRFGEQLVRRLADKSQLRWEVLTASRPDTHTLHHIQFLETMLPYQPDVVILLYVFNDIDYLHPVTPRTGQSEAPKSLLARLNPVRVLYLNSFLFQDIYVRMRLAFLNFGFQDGKSLSNADPYDDLTTVETHLQDLSRFISMAREAGSAVLVVPFEIGVQANTDVRRRYERFVNLATHRGIRVASVEGAFSGYGFDELTLNKLDRHPNALAHRLLAEAVDGQVLQALRDTASTRTLFSATAAYPRIFETQTKKPSLPRGSFN